MFPEPQPSNLDILTMKLIESVQTGQILQAVAPDPPVVQWIRLRIALLNLHQYAGLREMMGDRNSPALISSYWAMGALNDILGAITASHPKLDREVDYLSTLHVPALALLLGREDEIISVGSQPTSP